MEKLPIVKTAKCNDYMMNYAIEKQKEILIAYLFDGLSNRKLDKKVLLLDEQVTHGYESMAILHSFGIDVEFKGFFKGIELDAAIERMKGNYEYFQIIEVLTKPEDKTTDIISLPPLVRKKRKSEYNHYSEEQICEVLKQYLFNGRTHRQLDKEVLGLDYKKSKGYQSFAILNYLGVNGAFKGLFKSTQFEVAIEQLNKAGEDYFEILQLLLNENSKIPKEKKAGVEPGVIELKLSSYCMHGSKIR